jgi:hypothetical protein
MVIINNQRPSLKDDTKTVFQSIADAFRNRGSIVPLSEMVPMAKEIFGGLRPDCEVLRRNAKNLCAAVSETLGLPTRIDVSNETQQRATEELKAKGIREASSIVLDLIAPNAQLKSFITSNYDYTSKNGGTSEPNGLQYHLRTKNPILEQGANDGIVVIKDKDGTPLRIQRFLGTSIGSSSTPQYREGCELSGLAKDSSLLKIIKERLTLMNKEVELRDKSGHIYSAGYRRAA